MLKSDGDLVNQFMAYDAEGFRPRGEPNKS